MLRVDSFEKKLLASLNLSEVHCVLGILQYSTVVRTGEQIMRQASYRLRARSGGCHG